MGKERRKIDSEHLRKRMESEQLAMVPICNKDLVCKDCLLRYDDTVILGNVSRCEQYPQCKPDAVLLGKECSCYIKE